MASDAAGGRVLPVDVVDFVVERADGLPLLVEEVLTGLVESGVLSTGGVWEQTGDLTAAVPAGLRHIVETRLARLDPSQRAVLDAVAVGGADLPWRLVAVATGFDDPVVLGALRAGVDANLLSATEPAGGVLAQTGAGGTAGSGLGWRHDLTRQAVLHLMLPPERQRVAGALADALAAADGGRRRTRPARSTPGGCCSWPTCGSPRARGWRLPVRSGPLPGARCGAGSPLLRKPCSGGPPTSTRRRR